MKEVIISVHRDALHARCAIRICLLATIAGLPASGVAPIGVLAARAIEALRDVPGDAPGREGLLVDPLYAGRRESEWIKLLESDNPALRLAATRSLGDMGPEAKPAVPSLIKKLDERDAFIRSAAAYSLGQIGPDAARAIPAMVRALKTSSYFHQGIIGPSIGKIGAPAVPALIDLTRDADDSMRWEATRAIRLIGPAASAAEARLIELLSDEKRSVRVEAAFALWKLAARRQAVDVLGQCLEDPDEFARLTAAVHLAEIGPDAEPALPALIRALADQSPPVPGAAARALGKIGPRAKAAVPALLQSSFRPGQGSAVADSAKGIGPEAVPALIVGLDDPAVRATAAESLGKLGTGASAAVPRLRALVNNAPGKERHVLALALWRIIRDPGAVPVLIDLVRKDEFVVRLWAFDALAEIGPAAKDTIPTLTAMLGQNNRFLREYASKVLGRIGPEARSAIPALEKILRDPEPTNRIVAATALWRIARAEGALKTLFEEARHAGDSASTFAVIALGEIGPEAKAGVPALIDALNSDSILGKAIVAKALSQIGPEARAAVPRLIEIHNDLFNTERASFASAIKAIDPEAAARAGIRATATPH
jgi:HEAT repeat protein